MDSLTFRGSIAVVSAETPRCVEFIWSLLRVVLANRDVAVAWYSGPEVAVNRNNAVRNMQGDWLWCLDDDSIFAADILARLVPRLEEVDIVAPLCVRRSPPWDALAYRKAGNDQLAILNPSPSSGLVQADVVTTMGMLAKRSVFERMEPPWFRVGQGDAEHNRDDVDFCLRARAAGVEIACDTDVTMGHALRAFLWPSEAGVALAMGDGIGFNLPRSLLDAERAPHLVGR